MMQLGQIARADALLMAGNRVAARRTISEVLEAEPRNKHALLLLTHIEFGDGNPEQVMEICRRVLALYPNDERVRGELICLLARLKNHDEAQIAFDTFVRDFPHSTQINELRTVVNMNRGNIAGLKDDLEQLRSDRGDSTTVSLIEGYLAEAEGSDAGAFASGTNALLLEPTNSAAHNLVARTAFRLFWLPSAFRHAKAALRSDPKSEQMRGICRMSIACAFPPVLIACVGLRLAGWLNPKAIPRLNFRLLLVIFLIGALGFALESIGIHRSLFYAAIGLSAFYILIETFVVTEREEKRSPETVELRDY